MKENHFKDPELLMQIYQQLQEKNIELIKKTQKIKYLYQTKFDEFEETKKNF